MYYQEKIRNTEWEAVKPFIPKKSKFLDVGCGAGFNLWKARNELECDVQGIDPYRGSFGVGRNFFPVDPSLPIDNGFAEFLPYGDETFDIVFSSHVLEHVHDIPASLNEMKRVLKDNGTLIIGMPTATMAWIDLTSELIFTSHMRFVNFFLSPFINTGKIKFINVFIPPSHSYPWRELIFYDLKHYKISNWKNIVSSVFNIQNTLMPALYPFPDYRQLFKMRKESKISSSVFFICKK